MNNWIEHLESKLLCALLKGWEFDTPGIPAEWNYQTAVWADQNPGGEKETYNGGNVTVSGGALNLTAKDPLGNTTSGEAHTSGGWTYGNQTPPGYSFKFGYIEVRAKMPAAIQNDAGLWPAIWMMPTPNGAGNLHDNGEIDICENVPDGSINDLDSVHLHYSGQNAGKDYHTGVDLSAAYHTYGLDWRSNSLTWYFDGKVVMTVTGSVPVDEHYIILNLAVGLSGSWPGAPNAQTANPAVFAVDYVRVYDVKPSAAPNPYDLDGNGSIGIGDLTIFNQQYGQHGTGLSADFDKNGVVDIHDLGALATVYGQKFNADYALVVAAQAKHVWHARRAA